MCEGRGRCEEEGEEVVECLRYRRLEESKVRTKFRRMKRHETDLRSDPPPSRHVPLVETEIRFAHERRVDIVCLVGRGSRSRWGQTASPVVRNDVAVPAGYITLSSARVGPASETHRFLATFSREVPAETEYHPSQSSSVAPFAGSPRPCIRTWHPLLRSAARVRRRCSRSARIESALRRAVGEGVRKAGGAARLAMAAREYERASLSSRSVSLSWRVVSEMSSDSSRQSEEQPLAPSPALTAR